MVAVLLPARHAAYHFVSHANPMAIGVISNPRAINHAICQFHIASHYHQPNVALTTLSKEVYGIDISKECVAASCRTNQQPMRKGCIAILQASVSGIPFPNHTFDLVTAMFSLYYWPDMLADLREVLRVLRPGGRLLLSGECCRGGKFEARDRQFVESVHQHCHTIQELSE